ncbi:MAG: cytochrome c oxidase subunit 3 [Gammaproteobacteria bacterium]|nr:MAG: cytochrome c oxidase subunit 3 [Gammaproteobacteria bacterium]PCJ19701.1 MAG: cytochrome c oxidase subunit 3 [Gammaproteobacteria bacterium]
MSTNNSDQYYVPESSGLALTTAAAVATMVGGLSISFNGLTFGDGTGGMGWIVALAGFTLFIATLFVWFRTTIIENHQGLANQQLKKSYALGMQWFIFSEVCFFFIFFGTLFYLRNLAGPWLGGEGTKVGDTNGVLWQGFQYAWPMMTTPQEAIGISNQVQANNGTFTSPTGLMHWDGIPLINTILLLSSSVTCHFAHTALLANNRSRFNIMLGITLILGFVFVGFQVEEYREAYVELGLTLKSGVYGSTFFLLTGFHGFHVCMGATILLVQWLRSTTKGDFTAEDHFGFEAAAWYWHFVDVVWVCLFLFVYII